MKVKVRLAMKSSFGSANPEQQNPPHPSQQSPVVPLAAIAEAV